MADAQKTAEKKVYYHNYVCPSLDCLKAKNPTPNVIHQRGVNLATDKPRRDVRCPACSSRMIIGRDGCADDGSPHKNGHIGADANGNLLLNGRPLIHEAPGQLDQTDQIVAEDKAATEAGIE